MLKRVQHDMLEGSVTTGGFFIGGLCVDFIKSLWRGEQSLAFTFWVMGVLVSFVLFVIIEFLNIKHGYDGGFIANQSLILASGDTVSSILIIVQSIYIFIISICLWKCAGTYLNEAKQLPDRKSIWGYIARFGTISWMLNRVIMLLIAWLIYYGL